MPVDLANKNVMYYDYIMSEILETTITLQEDASKDKASHHYLIDFVVATDSGNKKFTYRTTPSDTLQTAKQAVKNITAHDIASASKKNNTGDRGALRNIVTSYNFHQTIAKIQNNHQLQ